MPCGVKGALGGNVIFSDLLAALTLTCCDTVTSYFDVGKIAVLKVLGHG